MEEAAEAVCPLLVDRGWSVTIVASGCSDGADIIIDKAKVVMIDESKALRGKTARIDLKPIKPAEISAARVFPEAIEPQLGDSSARRSY